MQADQSILTSVHGNDIFFAETRKIKLISFAK